MESGDGGDGVDTSPNRSRPAIGFPVGTAILFLLIFFFSGIISCCFQRDRRRPRSLRRPQPSNAGGQATAPRDSLLPKNQPPLNKDLHVQSIPVVMPGEQIPTYMAWPCPCKASSLPSPLPSPPTRIDVLIDGPNSCSPPSTSTNSAPTTPSSIRRHYYGVYV